MIQLLILFLGLGFAFLVAGFITAKTTGVSEFAQWGTVIFIILLIYALMIKLIFSL